MKRWSLSCRCHNLTLLHTRPRWCCRPLVSRCFRIVLRTFLFFIRRIILRYLLRLLSLMILTGSLSSWCRFWMNIPFGVTETSLLSSLCPEEWRDRFLIPNPPPNIPPHLPSDSFCFLCCELSSKMTYPLKITVFHFLSQKFHLFIVSWVGMKNARKHRNEEKYLSLRQPYSLSHLTPLMILFSILHMFLISSRSRSSRPLRIDNWLFISNFPLTLPCCGVFDALSIEGDFWTAIPC